MSTVFRVEKNKNYTVMSNIHLKDRRLSLKAKGLLSVILSLPPEWDYTVTGLAYIVAEGANSVRTAVQELESFGYITRRQGRDDLGRMSANEYHVYEDPRQNPDYSCEENLENSSMSEKADNIFLASPSADKPLTENPSTDKPTTATFNKLNTNKINTQSSITHPRATREKEDLTERTEGRTDFHHNNSSFVDNSKREVYLDSIHENIEYDSFAEKDKADELVGVMLDVMCSQKETIRVNGEELPTEQVKKRFLELKKAHIEHALNVLESNAGNVRNIRAYLITALYNAPTAVYSATSRGSTNSAPSNSARSYSAPSSAYPSRNTAAPAPQRPSYAMGSSFDMDDVFARIKGRYNEPRENDDWLSKDEQPADNWQQHTPKYVLLDC